MALQLALYANAEGIWVPPVNGTPDADLLEQQLDDDIANGANIPAGRRKWSQDAIKEAKTALNELRWREYSRLGTHLPMPVGLNTDKGIIVHLTDKKCELVPMDLTGAREVVFGMAKVHHWKGRRDIVGKPLVAQASAQDIQALRDLDKELEGVAVPDLEAGRDDSVGLDLRTSQEQPTLDTPDEAALHLQAIDLSDIKPAATLEELGQRSVEANIAQNMVTPDTLKDRVRAMSQEAKQELVFRWPGNVPTLKTGGHTDEQLGQVAQLIFEVETKFSQGSQPVLEPMTEDQVVARVLDLFPGSKVEPRAFDAPPPAPPQFDEEPF